MNIISEKIKEKFLSSGRNYILIIGIIGIMLISFSELFPQEKQVKSTIVTTDSYSKELGKQMETLLSMVNGAGDVKVMITMESGQENIYAQQTRTTQDEYSQSQKTGRYTYENEIVMVEENNEKHALIEKTLEPVVKGVVVVCSGADDIKVVSDITNAVSVALNVTTNRICVIKME